MKAMHRKSGACYKVGDIIGGIITLEGIETGQLRKVDYKKFKAHYELVDEDVKVNVSLTEDVELNEARVRANEILSEVSNGTIVHISFEDSKPKKEKRQKGKAKPKKGAKSIEKNKKRSNKEEGLITLKVICEEINIDPSKARRILRKSDIQQTNGKWEWLDKETINKIKSLLK